VDGAQLRAAGDELRVEVQAAAILRGRIDPPSVERRLRPAMRLVDVADPDRIYPDGDTWMPSGQAGSQIDARGHFELTGVPPGDWKVYLLTVNALGAGLGSMALEHVATVRGLRPGEVRTQVLDCRHLVPCALEGTALFAGRPAAFARIKLTTGSAPDATVVTLDADELGRFRGAITAGTYTVSAELKVDGQTAPQRATCAATLELAAGQRVVRRLQFVAR
jgi:hypothetical protein